METQTIDPIEKALQLAGEPTTVTPELEELDDDRITTDTEVEDEEFLIEIKGVPCFPRCDVSVFTGVPKTGKTFATSMLMACCIAPEVLEMKRVSEKPLKVMWMDTEQSVATTKRILTDRIGRMVGKIPDELFYVFNTRRHTPKERQERLALAIGTYRPDICIIDGITDLTDDINSGTDSLELMQLLLSLAQEYKCNITTNIHLNRSGEKFNLRGWIGTLIVQKSYEVFTCERLPDGKTFTLEMLFSRRYHMDEKMYYRIGDDGLPVLTKKIDTRQKTSSSSYAEKDTESSNSFNQEFVDQAPADKELPWQFRKLFTAAFKSAAFLSPDELERRVKELSNIKQKQYYYRVLNEAERLGIIKKTLTRAGRVGIIICPTP
ncbi:MAG: AAA family ATPase [Prevotella sp.]|nr:AAA family ATPase [Prevotella sp.]